MNAFTNYQHKQKITGYFNYSFSNLYGVDKIIDGNTIFNYVVDVGFGFNHVVIFNGDWAYSTYKNLTGAFYVKAVGQQLFIAGPDIIYKTDKHVNVILKYNKPGALYRSLYYNATSDRLFVASIGFKRIDIFDPFTLTLLYSINTTSFSPWSLNSYKNELFVGTSTGQILVLQNEIIMKTYATFCGSIVSSLLIDSYGFMAVVCNDGNLLFLNDTDVMKINESMSRLTNKKSINFDSKDR